MAAMTKDVIFTVATATGLPCAWKALNKGDRFDLTETGLVIYHVMRQVGA